MLRHEDAVSKSKKSIESIDTGRLPSTDGSQGRMLNAIDGDREVIQTR